MELAVLRVDVLVTVIFTPSEDDKFTFVVPEGLQEVLLPG